MIQRPEAWLIIDEVFREALRAFTSVPKVRVSHLEAVDGTPILDLKPILSEDIDQR